MRDMARVQAFPFGKGPARAASDLLNDGAEVISNDHLSEFLVRQVKRFQEIIVEEVAERAMADVVQQGRDAQEFLHIVDRGHVGELRCQEWVQMSSEASRDMHGSQRMDEPTMLGGRIDPSGALQLKHIAQSLNPGRI